MGIPVFYIILRIWGTLQFFYALVVSGIDVTPDKDHPGCIPQAVQIGYFIIAVFQVQFVSIIDFDHDIAIYHNYRPLEMGVKVGPMLYFWLFFPRAFARESSLIL